MHNTKEEQADFPVLIELPVQWGEMDAAGHVNNLIYLQWFESARAEYFTRMGQDIVFNEEDGPGFILGRQSCKYLFPVTYPDTVRVGVRVTDIGADRFTMHCKIWSARHQRLVAVAEGVIVTYNYHRREKVEVPEDMKKMIGMIEG